MALELRTLREKEISKGGSDGKSDHEYDDGVNDDDGAITGSLRHNTPEELLLFHSWL